MGDISKISELFQANKENIANFLTVNPKGKQVIPFLDQLATHLSGQYEQCLQDLEGVLSQLEDVKDLVRDQENLTGAERMLEPVSLKDLLEQALAVSQSQMIRHHISIERDYETIPKVVVDKYLCLRILVNLIHRAK